MRAFDWKSLFSKHRVPYIDRGANVKRDEINIRCPWCGNSDPSFHLGLNLGSGWYSCWRNRGAHSGKSPVRLVMKLLGVGYHAAREVCGLGEDFIDPEGFDAAAARIMGREPLAAKPAAVRREFLALDGRFIPIVDDGVRVRRHWNYLYRRGFDADDIVPLCRSYGLMACREGPFAQRLIIPFFLDGNLVTWTGRAIAGAQVRYMDLSLDEAVVPAKHTLFNHDCIAEGGDVLVLVEGPIDTLKLDHYGKEYGIRSVAMSTNSMTDQQTYMLEAAATRFRYIGVMMDAKTPTGAVDTMRMRDSLHFLPDVRGIPVPAGRGDAGECLPSEVRAWARKLSGVT